MKLVTKRILIEGVVAAWEQQFGRDPERPKCKAILTALRSLDLARATEMQITRIIGNRSWTRIECIECGQECVEAFVFGKAAEDADSPVYVCRACLENVACEILETACVSTPSVPRHRDLCLEEA